MRKIFFIIAMFFALISCTDDTNFQVVESEVGGVEIIGDGGKNIHLAKDTSWYVSDADGKRIYSRCYGRNLQTFKSWKLQGRRCGKSGTRHGGGGQIRGTHCFRSY